MLAIYDDPYQLKAAQIWKWSITGLQKVDLEATYGQIVRSTFLIHGTTPTPQNVGIYSDRPNEVFFDSGGPTAPITNQLNVTIHENATYELRVRGAFKLFYFY